MNHLLQILIFLFTCFTSSDTFSAPKFVVPTNTSIFQKTEIITLSEKAKIGVENFARSSIEQQKQNTTFHQNTFSFSLSINTEVENSCALDFQKTRTQNQISVAQFSKKESLSKLENRTCARRVNGVSTAGKVSKFGQRLDDIGEVLENGLVKGKYSKRTFDPNMVGDKILDLSFNNAIFIKTESMI